MTEENSRSLPRPVRVGSLLLAGSAVAAAVMAVAAVAAWGNLEIEGHRYLATLVLLTANDDESRIQQMCYSLAYNVATTAGTAVAAAVLALLIRRRLRGVRVAAYCLTGATILAFGCGLASGPDSYGVMTPLPAWYAGVHTLLVVGVLVAMVAMVVLVRREPADEFYRVGRRTEDPEWTAFLQQRARRAGADGPR